MTLEGRLQNYYTSLQSTALCLLVKTWSFVINTGIQVDWKPNTGIKTKNGRVVRGCFFFVLPMPSAYSITASKVLPDYLFCFLRKTDQFPTDQPLLAEHGLWCSSILGQAPPQPTREGSCWGRPKSHLAQCLVPSYRHKRMPNSRNKASVYRGTTLPFNTLPGSHSGDLFCWVLVPFLFSSSLTASIFPRRLLRLSKCCNATRRKVATNCILSREINRHSYV